LEEYHQLIQECKAHNRVSQEKLYRQFYPGLILLCKRLFADDRDAMESLNDGMLKVFNQLDKYEPEKGNFFNWVYTVVRNSALDKLRSRKFPDTDELHYNLAETLKDNPVSSLESKDIYILLDSLSPATRAVCSLFYLEGFSINDIAEKLGISKGTVKWHLSETRKRLKPVLLKFYL
jgi:RNA polymerase sigma factor (sigma-70 family)